METIQPVVGQARALRLEANALIAQVARPAHAAAIPQRIDHLIRQGGNPAELQSHFAALAKNLDEATKQHAALETIATRFAELYPRLEQHFALIPEGTINHILLSSELRLCAGVMAALSSSVQRAALEAGVAAALSDQNTPTILTEKPCTSPGGIILPTGC